MSDFWTDLRITTLRKAIADGLSRTQAGELLGTSRSACTGKAHRLGLQFRHDNDGMNATRRAARLERRKQLYRAKAPQKAAKAPSSPSATPMPLKLHAPTAERLSASEPLPGTEPRPLMDLKPRMCRWPLGLDGNGDRLFCAGRTPEISPYCEHHARLAIARRAA